MTDVQDLSFRLYEQAVIAQPENFRALALEQSRALLAYDSAAWIMLHPDSSLPGSVERYRLPDDCLRETPAAVAAGMAEGLGTHELTGRAPRLPAPLADGLRAAGMRHCLAFRARHHGQLAESLVLLGRRGSQAWSTAEQKTAAEFLPQLVAAGVLALRAYVMRDALLQRLGRPNREGTALIDRSGAIYDSDERFRATVRGAYPNWDGEHRLPFPAPPSGEWPPREETIGELRLRGEPLGDFWIIHARALRPLDRLSRREREIVRAIVSGHTLKTIGSRLGISPSTVANHAARIYEKLGIHNRDALVELVKDSLKGIRQQG